MVIIIIIAVVLNIIIISHFGWRVVGKISSSHHFHLCILITWLINIRSIAFLVDSHTI
ncbi:hypothetical protein BGZ63DRAFT_380073 [Mariannaea sp. PMI_226]|nr:hypothetical protein BGZ63DRAFT_380073 [Mariannaea sp. PMI_226]